VGEENLAPTGFDPRTVQPVAIRYPGPKSRIFCSKYNGTII